MIRLLTIESNKEKWFLQAAKVYEEKINHLYKFKRIAYKSSGLARASSDEKIQEESKVLISKLEDAVLIICDEKGKNFDSKDFSRLMIDNIESGHRKIDFVIGGAFGLSDEIKARASYTMTLAPFVLNHLVAQTVLMEQIYRGLSIWKGLPYHNE